MKAVSIFLDWLDSTRLWKWLAKNLVSHLTFRIWGYPSFDMSDFWKISSRMVPGKYYVFASSDYCTLASIMIRMIVGKRSMFSHAGLILSGHPGNLRVMHMMGIGLVIEDILELLKKQDYFAVIEIDVQKDDIDEVDHRIDFIIENRQTYRYDFQQTIDESPYLLYCSELIYVIFKDVIMSMVPRDLWDRKVFDPDMIAKCGKVIYSNHPRLEETR